ncbi:unnamed protein product [Prunus armeniaca]
MDAVVRILGYLKFAPGKGSNLVTWRSKKLKVVYLLSADAEYRAMSAIKIAENPIQHDIMKHVEIDRNFIYEELEENIIEVPYVKTIEQLEDMLTKAVSNRAFTDSLVKLGICDIYAPYLGECWRESQ